MRTLYFVLPLVTIATAAIGAVPVPSPTHAPADAWTTFSTKSLLGGSLLGQKKYAEAEPMLLAGYEGMKQREARIPPRNRVYLTNALERLVQLQDARDSKDEAARWRKRLDEARTDPKAASRDKPQR
jgi:hypothetical protein